MATTAPTIWAGVAPKSMISGSVDGAGKAWVTLAVEGPTGSSTSVEAAVDTGFNGFLTLPPEVIGLLDLAPRVPTMVTLGTGIRRRLNTWDGQVQWHEGRKRVQILQAQGIPLIGMSLLEGSRLTVDVEIGGLVSIEEL